MPVASTTAAEDQPRFSPDGKWMAYRSNQTGRREIYLQRLPSGEPRPMSVDGGSKPFWRRDGHELFFVSPDNWLMKVATLEDESAVGSPSRLFTLPETLQCRCPLHRRGLHA